MANSLLRAAARAKQKVREIHADDQQNQTDSTPQHDQRPPQLAADVLFQSRKLACVTLSVFRMLVLEIELRKELIGLALRLRRESLLVSGGRPTPGHFRRRGNHP